jgi:uncharacterized protein
VPHRLRAVTDEIDADTPRSALEPWPDRVDWRPVSAKLIAVELIRRLGTLLVLAVAVVVAWDLTGAAAFGAALAAVVVLAGWLVWITARAVHAWGYAERPHDLLVRHGLLVRRLSIVPYARMQFVDVTAGPVERAFGLATVRLHTASAASDARVPGLPPAEAVRLRDRLTALGEDRSEGL